MMTNKEQFTIAYGKVYSGPLLLEIASFLPLLFFMSNLTKTLAMILLSIEEKERGAIKVLQPY
jgi:hypothetical protein